MEDISLVTLSIIGTFIVDWETLTEKLRFASVQCFLIINYFKILNLNINLFTAFKRSKLISKRINITSLVKNKIISSLPTQAYSAEFSISVRKKISKSFLCLIFRMLTDEFFLQSRGLLDIACLASVKELISFSFSQSTQYADQNQSHMPYMQFTISCKTSESRTGLIA